MAFVGIDVGAQRLHCVAVDEELHVLRSGVCRPGDAGTWATGATMAAVDAPAELSTAPHRDDPSLSPKFAVARCGEIALGRDYGSWVPWVTPQGPPIPTWMAAGFAAYRSLADVGVTAIEVYPHACFRRLVAPARAARKQTAAGIRQRADALRERGVREPHLELWSHDALDALVAALVARDHANGTAVAATCGHDGSAIWLPAL